MQEAHDLLAHERVLANVAGEPAPETDSLGLDVQAGLDEGDRRVLQVELGPSGERVVDTVNTERL